MPPRGLIERRDADEAMHAGFGRQQPEGVLARDREGRALDPRVFTRLVIDDFALESAALAPAQVHAQEHLRPVLRLGAAGARMDRDDRVPPVVLPAEHLLDLGGLHDRLEILDSAGEVGRHVFSALGPLDEHGEVVGLAAQRLGQRDLLLEAPAALQQLLGFALVFPEIGFGDASL